MIQPCHQMIFKGLKRMTGEEILPSNQQQLIQQAKFNYSPLGRAIEKQIKTIKDQGEKQDFCFRIFKGF